MFSFLIKPYLALKLYRWFGRNVQSSGKYLTYGAMKLTYLLVFMSRTRLGLAETAKSKVEAAA